MRITLKDIAKTLDMDESTVSYALAGKGSINPETRRKIRETAEQLGYVPNQAARQTSTGKNNTIAIVVPNVLMEYGEFCEYAFRQLRKNGYQTQIQITEFSAEKELEIIRSLVGGNITGVLLIPALPADGSFPESLKLLQANNIAVIVRNELPGVPNIRVDYREFGRIFGEKFKRNHRKRICVAVPHPEPFAENVTEVIAGMKEHLTADMEIRIESPGSAESLPADGGGINAHYENQIRNMLSRNGINAGRELFQKMFSEPSSFRPDAIVCPHEICALGILREAESAGLLPPDAFDLVSEQQGLSELFGSRRISSCFVSQERLANTMTAHLLELLKTGQTDNRKLEPEFSEGETISDIQSLEYQADK